MKRIIIAKIFDGLPDDDIMFRVLPDTWLDAHFLDTDEIASEPFKKIDDLKFTDRGLGGLYWFDESELKVKLADLTKRAKQLMSVSPDGKIAYVFVKRHHDGSVVSSRVRNFFTDVEAIDYVNGLSKTQRAHWEFFLKKAGEDIV